MVNGGTMFRKFLMAVLMCAAVWMQLAAAVTPATAAAPRYRMNAQERAALKSLVVKAGGVKRVPIDLTDAQAKLAYFALLKAHGVTPENRPGLFKSFDEVEAAQAKRVKMGAAPVTYSECAAPTQPDDDIPMTGDEDRPIGNYREILDVPASDDFKTVQARALDTIVEPAVYTLDTLDVYDQEWEEQLGAGTDEVFSHPDAANRTQDPKFQVFETEHVADNNPSGDPVNVFGSFYYRTADKTPAPPCLVVVPGLAHGLPKDQRLLDPTNKVSPPGSPVVICINRQNATADAPACDYGPMMGWHDEWHVRMIVNGWVQFHDKVAPIVDADGTPTGNLTGEMTVIPTVTNGACPVLPVEGKTLVDHFKIDQADPTKLVFSWPSIDTAADFGKLCWGAVENNAVWDFVLSLRVKTLNKAGKVTYTVLTAFLSRAPMAIGVENGTEYVPQLAFQFGCLMAGTPVTMADGSQVPIEKVKQGDRVASPNGPLKVQRVTTGSDTSFVEISVASTAGGTSLFVTPTHPIAVAAQHVATHSAPDLVEAEDLLRRKVGAASLYVLSQVGGAKPARVPATIRPVSKSASVYNLTLEKADGTPLPAKAGLFYANGILVGDNAAQGALAAERAVREAKRPDYRPSGLELVDYKNWLAERATARKAQLPQSVGNR